jgi:hypothetical protein
MKRKRNFVAVNANDLFTMIVSVLLLFSALSFFLRSKKHSQTRIHTYVFYGNDSNYEKFGLRKTGKERLRKLGCYCN